MAGFLIAAICVPAAFGGLATEFALAYGAVRFAQIFLLAIAYFWFYSRHHLVASAPEEEFAALAEAEAELN